MNFCKDCAHFIRSDQPFILPKCGRTKVETLDPVTGEQSVKMFTCSTERQASQPTDCGPDARFFEPRT